MSILKALILNIQICYQQKQLIASSRLQKFGLREI